MNFFRPPGWESIPGLKGSTHCKYGLWLGFKTFGPSETIGGKAALLNKYIKYIKEIEITAG
jgi:hypothetical protein